MVAPVPSTSGTDEPVDAIVERLNDPAVAASVVTLLDHAELLSTLVIGLGGFVERGEVIMDAVADGVNELRTVQRAEDMPSPAELADAARTVATAAPALQALLESSMLRPETISLLSLVGEAATDGARRAADGDTRMGPVALVRSLAEPEVQRGLGMVIEISRALGRRIGSY